MPHAARHRRSIRLPDHDYTTPGAYFVTICTHGRECLFGEVVGEGMVVNVAGMVVRDEWLKTDMVRPGIILDEFVVMPNHFHGILIINAVGATRWVAHDDGRQRNRATHRVAPTPGPPSGSIGAIIGQFKSAVTKRLNALRHAPGLPVWQRNYYEHVIRDDRDLAAIREYVATNPARWLLDKNHPANGAVGR